MYKNSPSRRRDPRVDLAAAGMLHHVSGSQSPTKSKGHQNISAGVRQSSSASSLLSPGRSRSRRGVSSNHGSRSGSPLSLQMENAQSMNTAYNMSQTYLGEGMGSPVPSPGRSPYQSPAHSRSSSMSSMKSLVRDRSSERSDRDHMVAQAHLDHHHHGHAHGHSQHSSLVRDRSLDRQLDRHHKDLERYHTFSARDHRDRPVDREYPYMGARSLERDHGHHSNLVRSRSIDHEYMTTQAAFLPVHDFRMNRGESLILDMQSQIAELNKECARMQHEMEVTKEKLSSSMNSIKTFWSPELKKERMLRKEECAKYANLNEQYKMTQAENQRLGITLQHCDDDMKSMRDVVSGRSNTDTADVNMGMQTLRREKDRQSKEVVILRKTVEEMELRIDTQKQTLAARDESLKKLMEMLQSKGLAVKQLEEDRIEMDQLRARTVEGVRRTKQLENILEVKDREICHLKEDVVRKSDDLRLAQSGLDRAKNLPTNTDVLQLQAMMESKESRIQVLEDELSRLQHEGATSVQERRDSGTQLEALRSQERLLKAKVDNLQGELGKRDSDMCAIRTQLESQQKQSSDSQHHIVVLREKISAKEQQANHLQADMDLLHTRLKEKDESIDKKARQAAAAMSDKKKLETELMELQDHMGIKERKISVLQRKIENLEEVVKDKDGQINLTQAKLASIHADQSSSDSALSSLEDSLSDKEKQIDRLKEQRERSEREHQEEVEAHQSSVKELNSKLETLQSQLDDRQHAVLELREEMSQLKSEKMKQDSRIRGLEDDLIQKTETLGQLQGEIKKLQEEKEALSTQASKASAEGDKTAQELEEQKQEQATRAQAEVDRLLAIMKASEDEKCDKDKQIQEMQEQLKEYRQKMGTLKRNQQSEKTKNAHMLEEARKREEEVSVDSTQLKNILKQNEDRIEELEEALRESVKITAQREVVLAQQQIHIEQTDRQAQHLAEELEDVEKAHEDTKKEVSTLKDQLVDQKRGMSNLHEQRKDQLQEVYEMKQEAILAAISEKDAHIALLELQPNRKPGNVEQVEKLTWEKQKLQKQLKELTQNRMKLMHTEDLNGSSLLASKMQGAPTDQVVQAIRHMECRKRRLQSLIDRIVAICLDIDVQLLEGLPRMQQAAHRLLPGQLCGLEPCQLLYDLSEKERDCRQLENYVDLLLSRVKNSKPELLYHLCSWLDAAVTAR